MADMHNIDHFVPPGQPQRGKPIRGQPEPPQQQESPQQEPPQQHQEPPQQYQQPLQQYQQPPQYQQQQAQQYQQQQAQQYQQQAQAQQYQQQAQAQQYQQQAQQYQQQAQAQQYQQQAQAQQYQQQAQAQQYQQQTQAQQYHQQQLNQYQQPLQQYQQIQVAVPVPVQPQQLLPAPQAGVMIRGRDAACSLAPNRRSGITKWFNATKGWGFITPDKFEGMTAQDAMDVFVHQSEIRKDGFRSLYGGEPVEFDTEFSAKGQEAKNVTGPGGAKCIGSDKAPTRRRTRKVRCYNCGEFSNHLAAKCPEGNLDKRCHFCKSTGHLIAECPLKYQGPRGGPPGTPHLHPHPHPRMDSTDQTVDIKLQEGCKLKSIF